MFTERKKYALSLDNLYENNQILCINFEMLPNVMNTFAVKNDERF